MAQVYGDACDIGGNKHASPNRFARQYAEDGQRHQAKLLNRCGHPFLAPGLAQEPAPGQPNGAPHQCPHPQLLNDIGKQDPASPLGADLGHGNEKHQEGDGKPIVEAGFHIEGLADAEWHPRTVYDDLPQPGIGWGQDGGQDARFP